MTPRIFQNRYDHQHNSSRKNPYKELFSRKTQGNSSSSGSRSRSTIAPRFLHFDVFFDSDKNRRFTPTTTAASKVVSSSPVSSPNNNYWPKEPPLFQLRRFRIIQQKYFLLLAVGLFSFVHFWLYSPSDQVRPGGAKASASASTTSRGGQKKNESELLLLFENVPKETLERISRWEELLQDEYLNQNENNPDNHYDDDDDRPKNLHLVFVGDSVTRYQYYSLCYYLRHGKWIQDDANPNMLNHHDFSTWNKIYRYANEELAPNEQCDCYRPEGKLNITATYENRFFHDAQRNNYITYIPIFESNPPHGHWDPEDVYNEHGYLQDNMIDPTYRPYRWSYNYTDLIHNYIANLTPKPKYLIFNEGLHVGHRLGDEWLQDAIIDALEETNIVGIYKTTTLPNIEVSTVSRFMEYLTCGMSRRLLSTYYFRTRIYDAKYKDYDSHDINLCHKTKHCLDLSWTHEIKGKQHYVDLMHFQPHVYYWMNLQLLHLLNIIVDI